MGLRTGMNRVWNAINPPLSMSEDEKRALTMWNVFGDDDGGSNTASGTRVSERSAFSYGIVYSAISLIADTIAGLPPMGRKREDGNDSDSMVETELPQFVRKPHPDIRRFDFWQAAITSLLAWGNAYALIVRRESDGVIIGLDLLDPDTVSCEWDPQKPGYKRYRVSGKNGPGQWLGSNAMMHIQGPTLPGEATGMSVISQAREAIALGLTLQEYGSRYFGQGSVAKIVIEMPNKVDTPAALSIVKTYERFHKGKANWHRPAILSGGAKLHNISIPPEDAQFLESREFQALEVAGWFRVPPHRVGILSKSTSWGSGLAEENMMFHQLTLKPWINRIEDTLSAYSPGGAGFGTFIVLDTAELLRGTFAEQVETLGKMYELGAITKDEFRVALGWHKSLDDTGKDYYVMPPMTTLDDNGDIVGTTMGGGDPGGGGAPSGKTPDKPRTKEQDRKRKQKEAVK